MSFERRFIADLFEGMGLPLPRVARVCAVALMLAALLAPDAFRDELMAYAEREATKISAPLLKVIHQMEQSWVQDGANKLGR